jgi:hypothetical protein
MKQRLPLSDTDPEVERILIEMARATPAWKKFAQVAETTETCRVFAIAGIRSRHPDATDEEIKCRLAAIILGPELAKKVYGWDADVEGY